MAHATLSQGQIHFKKSEGRRRRTKEEKEKDKIDEKVWKLRLRKKK